ncbi:MAG: GNAT family N-acetyltransferase [Candidatus Saccharibacteria bacterium]
MNNHEINIRKATASDIETIIDLGSMLQDESKIYEPNLIFDRKSAIEHYSAELNNDDALIIVAEADNKIVGYQYSYITHLDYLSTKNIQCTFEAIIVLPEYRSIGIGKKITTVSENWAVNDKKANCINATIYSGNIVSEQLHLKTGFRPYSIEYVKDI